METREQRFNRWFNICILVGMALVTCIVTGIKFHTAESGRLLLLISAVGSLAGVLSTVCSANARILTFLFGLIDVSIYGVMCLLGAKYGNAALHLLYFLPMQGVGYWQWRRLRGGEKKTLQARRLSGRQRLLCGLAFLVGLGVVYAILLHFGQEDAAGVVRLLILADALSTVCNMLGQALLSTAYMEQWIFWIGVNITSVIMWVLTLHSDPSSSYALIYVIKYTFYLVNSLNGLRIWLGISRKIS